MIEDLNLQNQEFRYERKFVVPYLDKKEAELVILNNSFFFREIFAERQINNLYFDDFDKTCYFDNVLGNSDRVKFRIRWYGELMEVKKPVLEIKIKRGLVGTKLHFLLKPFDFPCGIQEIQRIFVESGLPNWLLEIMKSQQFSIVNSYKRKYFMSACKRFRITIDSNLAYWGVLNQSHLSLMKKVEEDHLILELKYRVQEDAEDVSTQFPFRMTKSSKYVTALNYFKGE